MASPSFLDLTASQVLDELAGPVAPGGGSALAFTVAMAAAVVRMAAPCRQAHGTRQAVTQRRADALRAAWLHLRSSTPTSSTRHSRCGTARQRSRRRARLGDRKAFAAAAEPPLEIASVAADVAELAAAVASSGERACGRTRLQAATLAAAAARAAVTIVEANHGRPGRRGSTRRRSSPSRRARARCRRAGQM